MLKKAPYVVEFKLLTNRHKQEQFSQNDEEGQIYKICLTFFSFVLQCLAMIFQNLVITW